MLHHYGMHKGINGSRVLPCTYLTLIWYPLANRLINFCTFNTYYNTWCAICRKDFIKCSRACVANIFYLCTVRRFAHLEKMQLYLSEIVSTSSGTGHWRSHSMQVGAHWNSIHSLLKTLQSPRMHHKHFWCFSSCFRTTRKWNERKNTIQAVILCLSLKYGMGVLLKQKVCT